MSQEFGATPDVTVLMPKITNFERTNVRYAGLFTELGNRGLYALMVEGMNSYDAETASFPGAYTFDPQQAQFIKDEAQLVRPGLVRDLTMAVGDRPLYSDRSATIVHNPKFNAVLADKLRVHNLLPHMHPRTLAAANMADFHDALWEIPGDRVVVKPQTGSLSEGLVIGTKHEVADRIAELGISRTLLVQSFIESQQGIPELGIEGRHNARVIMIGGKPIFAFGRLAAKDSLFIENDSFSALEFHDPDAFPEDLQQGVEAVRRALALLPDGRNTVIAADFMRGRQGDDSESTMYLCELNRRPLRNSPYDSRSPGNLWAARQWDVHEAELLQSKVAA